MTNEQMMEEYMKTLQALVKRHGELVEQITVYDKRVALLEEEIDEVWEVIATLRKHKEGWKYGRRTSNLPAGCGGQRIW
jgi:prefoldin subunit 5